MKIMPVKFLFIVFFTISASALAENVLPDELPDEKFLEFLAELENINDVWVHPIDLNNSRTDKANMTTNKTSTSEGNNE